MLHNIINGTIIYRTLVHILQLRKEHLHIEVEQVDLSNADTCTEKGQSSRATRAGKQERPGIWRAFSHAQQRRPGRPMVEFSSSVIVLAEHGNVPTLLEL